LSIAEKKQFKNKTTVKKTFENDIDKYKTDLYVGLKIYKSFIVSEKIFTVEKLYGKKFSYKDT